ncbi:histone deacetylase 2-like [Primulina huaijiensis]|uniref:histone deacetylase 2-like n=1 Tax=Primulina huaijiensis TaxID=1492673 RepID=UPI003CC70B88
MTAPSSSFGDCSSKGKFKKEDIESERRSRILSSKLYFDVPASMVHLESYLDSLKSSLNVASIVEVRYLQSLYCRTVLWLRVFYFLSENMFMLILLRAFYILYSLRIILRNYTYAAGWRNNFICQACKRTRMGHQCRWCFSSLFGYKNFAYADISLCILEINCNQLQITYIGPYRFYDLDAHQRNGHENDFSDDRRVYILVQSRYISMIMWPGDTSIRKLNGTATNEYSTKLDQALKVSTGLFDPELIIYNAGTDILDGDPLGRLKINPDGIPTRDERVFRFARKKNIPIVMQIGYRWLHEIQCQSNRRFHHKFVEEISDRYEGKKIHNYLKIPFQTQMKRSRKCYMLYGLFSVCLYIIHATEEGKTRITSQAALEFWFVS